MKGEYQTTRKEKTRQNLLIWKLKKNRKVVVQAYWIARVTSHRATGFVIRRQTTAIVIKSSDAIHAVWSLSVIDYKSSTEDMTLTDNTKRTGRQGNANQARAYSTWQIRTPNERSLNWRTIKGDTVQHRKYIRLSQIRHNTSRPVNCLHSIPTYIYG
jgi:hypothetical protein